MRYFIGDTHFFDEGIIKICDRPFKGLRDMHSEIIKNWNSVVTDNDEVYIVGDLAFGDIDVVELAKIVEELKGKKYLVRGNHDNFENDFYREIGFEEVYDKPIILDGFWIVSHEPMFVASIGPFVNIYAHVHDNPNYVDFSRRGACVSVERINYTPISFEDIYNGVNGR